MGRAMTEGPLWDFIYHTGMIGIAAAITYVFYLHVNGVL